MAPVLLPNSWPENASAIALPGQTGIGRGREQDGGRPVRHAPPKYNDLPLTGGDRNLRMQFRFSPNSSFC